MPPWDTQWGGLMEYDLEIVMESLLDVLLVKL